MKDYIEELAYLIGAVMDFETIVRAARSHPLKISGSVAQQLCSSLDSLISLDLLADVIQGRPVNQKRLEEIKFGLKTLDLLMTENGDLREFSESQKMLSAMNMTNSLLLLIELTEHVDDSQLLSLLLRLIVKMCVQHPENKAKMRDHLHTLSFAYHLPEFIELLDEFGFFADISVSHLRLLISEMIRKFIAEGGQVISALYRLADVFKTATPLFVISIVVIEAVTHWTEDPEKRKRLVAVLWKLSASDETLKRSLQMMNSFMSLLEKLKLDKYLFLDMKQEASRSISLRARESKHESLHEDEEVQMSVLTKITMQGHKEVLERLEKVDGGIKLILDSFYSHMGQAPKPLYFSAVQLFKLMGNAKRRQKAHLDFAQVSMDSVIKSGLHQELTHLLVLSKSPNFTMMLLRSLRALMQVNSAVVKEEILDVLQSNKFYFLVFSEFSRVCQQYLAEVHKSANPQFNLLVTYLKFFTVGCDLCTVSFQHFVREQIKDSATNIDILQTALKLMTAVGKVIEDRLKDNQTVSLQHRYMLRYLMTFLTEAISGPNVENQIVVGTTSSLYEALNAALHWLCKAKDTLREENKRIAASLLALFSALLEKEGMTDHSEVLKMIGKSLDFAALKELLVLIRKTSPAFHDVGVRICIFLCDFKANAAGLLDDEPEEQSKEALSTIKYFSQFIGNVEIEKGGTIYSVLFPIDKKSKHVTEFTKESLLAAIHKQPLRQEKLDDMLSGVKTCIIEIEVLSKRPKWLLAISPYWLGASRASFGFAILINILLLIYIRGTYHDNRMFLPDNLAFIVTLLGVGQCACYLVSMVLYWNTYFYTLFYPLVARTSSQDIKELASDSKLNQFQTPFQRKGDDQANEARMELQTGNILLLLYHLAFLGVSVFAIFYPPVYALLLLGVFSQNERFETIIKALTINWQMLLVTALLMCIIIYEFSMVAYLFFYPYYNSQTNLECDDLLNCFVSTLNIGLQGNLSDSLGEQREEDYWARLFFDLLFQIIILFVFLNAVFGIIIDAFGDLRDERNSIETDVNNNCLICGRDRSTIDLRGGTWQLHITQVHSYQMYLNFMIYICNKSSEDCSGIEKYVKEHITNNSVSFMPTTSSLLEQTEHEDTNDAGDSERYAAVVKKVREIVDGQQEK